MICNGRVSSRYGFFGGPAISPHGRVFSDSPAEQAYRNVPRVRFDPSPCPVEVDQYALTAGVIA